jgi:chorismate synthase
MLRLLTAGESHGPALTVVVDGLPAGLTVDRAAIDADLRRRQGGHGRGGRMRIESDSVEILSGVRHGKTLGSPVALVVRNKDHENWRDVMSPDPQPPEAKVRRAVKYPRPGHADLAGALKYLTDDLREVLERASARETTARVAAGALAKALLRAGDAQVRSHVVRIGEAALPPGPPLDWERLDRVEESPVRCADPEAAAAMVAAIDRARKAGDTVGGVFEVVVRGLPPGLGSFSQWDRKLDGRLAQALMSIPAVKAVAVGAGFEGGTTSGARFHDEILYDDEGRVRNADFEHYHLPSSMDVPVMILDHQETPSPFTPYGIKGAGEGGRMLTPAIMSAAIEDALSDYGVQITSLPISAEQIVDWVSAGKA